MYRIIDSAKYFFSISLLLAVSTVVLWFTWGLKLGLDFTGGSALQLHFPDAASRPSVDQVTTTLIGQGIEHSSIQTAGDSDIVIKAQAISNDQRQAINDTYRSLGVTESSFTSVGPALGAELKTKSFQAVGFVLLAIIVFISYAFRSVSRGPVPAWMYGLGALIALAHDVVALIGVFVVLGHFWDVQVDALFVTALLTVLGFSIHDTIVVYDRIREGLKSYGKKDFRTIINQSINTTMARSLNTSITVLIVLLALLLFGGEAIRWFVLALIVGIVTGTYSSIFIASPLLLVFERVFHRSIQKHKAKNL